MNKTKFEEFQDIPEMSKELTPIAEQTQFLVPYQFVTAGKIGDYLKLKNQYTHLLSEIKARSQKISDLYWEVRKQTVSMVEGNALIKPNSWHTALIVKSLSEDIIHFQGELEVVKAEFLEVKDMLKTLCSVYGVKEKFEDDIK